jgi:hypothetical protein
MNHKLNFRTNTLQQQGQAIEAGRRVGMFRPKNLLAAWLVRAARARPVDRSGRGPLSRGRYETNAILHATC